MTNKKYKITVGVFCLVAIALGFWREQMTRMFAESIGVSEYSVYDNITIVGDWRVGAFPYLVIAMLGVALTIGLLAGRTGSKTVEYKDIASVFCSSLCAFMMITTAFFNVYYYFSGAEYSVLEWSIVCMMLLSCGFFLYATSKNVEPRGKLFMVLAVLPIVLMALRVMEYFFTVNSRPVDANELFHLFSLCAIMMFFLEEGKFSAGCGNPKAYIFYGLGAVLLTFVYSLPHALLSAFWVVSFSVKTIYSCLELVIVALIIGRLFNYQMVSQSEE